MKSLCLQNRHSSGRLTKRVKPKLALFNYWAEEVEVRTEEEPVKEGEGEPMRELKWKQVRPSDSPRNPSTQ